MCRPDDSMGVSNIWTPRRTTKLWPRQPGYQRHPFSPDISQQPYSPPPPPSPIKKAPPPKAASLLSSELGETADALRDEAAELESQIKVQAIPLKIQLGQLMLSKDDFLKKILKDWNSKGKDELKKAELRLNLRNVGLNATSAEADDLFDYWDTSGDGSLDMNELRQALMGVMKEARNWKIAPDPLHEKAEALRHRAKLTDEAAAATAQAESIEKQLTEMTEQLESRADVRLGALLFRRRIKPGAVVTQWSKSRGEHAMELSKKEFRDAVIKLGVQAPTTVQDIDNVFDQFDEDGGGFMDQDEAKKMIKELQKTAEKAEHEKWIMSRDAERMRNKAHKISSLAQAAPMPEPAPLPAYNAVESQPLPTPAQEAKKTPKKKKKAPAVQPSASESEAVDLVPALDVDGRADTDNIDMMSERSIDADPMLMAADGDSATVAFQAATRLSNLDLSRAWNAWMEMREHQIYFHEVLEDAARRFRNPLLYRAINTWQTYHADSKKSMHRVRKSLRMMKLKDLIYAWTVWRTFLKRERLYSFGIMAFAAKSMPHVKMAFFTWRSQLVMRPETKPQTGGAIDLCRALRRCFDRDGPASGRGQVPSAGIELLQA